jgi:hypothetical protein
MCIGVSAGSFHGSLFGFDILAQVPNRGWHSVFSQDDLVYLAHFIADCLDCFQSDGFASSSELGRQNRGKVSLPTRKSGTGTIGGKVNYISHVDCAQRLQRPRK